MSVKVLVTIHCGLAFVRILHNPNENYHDTFQQRSSVRILGNNVFVTKIVAKYIKNCEVTNLWKWTLKINPNL